MSQVVVTNDNLREKRAKSMTEEHRIDNLSQFARWKMPVGSQTARVEGLIGLALSPIALVWSVLLTLFGVGLALALTIFKILASLLPKMNQRPARKP